MSTKRENTEEIIGYEPFETILPKKKKKLKPKKPKPLKIGQQYDPTPKDFGKQFDPMNDDPQVIESFAYYFLKALREEAGLV